MNEFQTYMQEIVDRRGGKLRVPGLEPDQYTFWVADSAWKEALDCGYIGKDGAVTGKFRKEYDQMFDRIGVLE